ncbi:three-Cys-motif partner protein TcmP [Marilutibacter maris]|uniref:Three-Cys-motif partner protein TcmP n=1 Tax=Marilutibacter maris TaxID=1605891 RepID=A0A2U9TEZ0_9GAMM|nr:three-Cys-motif partner protein TcmP [Lysobacter maris]AWV08189.1 hypothetical protein C9I47_2511 [Lysobacter maris]
MALSRGERHDTDPDDGLRRDVVGEWHSEKHRRLEQYVDITKATRKKFAGNAPSYVDLYCATGRSITRDTREVVDGSPLVAARAAAESVPFREIHIGDMDAANVQACESRLAAADLGQVVPYVGLAEATARQVVKRLNPYGLHLALLDPYSLKALPFEVVQILSGVKRMDLIVHISEMDLQRNVLGKGDFTGLDTFAPGWRDVVDLNQNSVSVKRQVLDYWMTIVGKLGYHVSDNIVRVTGARNQPLYWLALASRHALADRFWGEIRGASPQSRFTF